MIKIGKLIPPSREIVCLMLESFDVETQTWCDPVESKISLSKEKFASGGCRDAFHATGLSGVAGKLVLKRYRKERVADITALFSSVDSHTRKVVQMHSLARHFAKKLRDEAPLTYGETFMYTKLYYSKHNEEYVTVEHFLPGNFKKFINNTGDIIIKDEDRDECALKAETFAHYSYAKSGKQLMVLDLQGVDYWLCDPEVASATLFDDNRSIFFCSGNLSVKAIDNFVEQHICNDFCKALNLDI
eukprot:Seg2769.3 transcript_id=Seg2769.3/GoldUCD/mRNA.D3Y31 product="Transient receptor potential cation channel subfamily M member 6" protein_id=Seg2769.3/GoldUCD/D3Y31